MTAINFNDQDLFSEYRSTSNATLQINLKINEADLRLIDEKAKRYGLTRSSLIKIFAINGELNVNNLDRDNLRMPIT
jgi:hypothetical protein|tara:strand:+ start:308 stop:538 length:231 start_codon:yes stop_codon:yes gene_type:complete